MRLRVLIWTLVIGLWGVLVYEYLGEKDRDIAKMTRISPYGALQPGNTAYSPAAMPPVAPPAAAPSSDARRNALPLPEYVGPAPSTSRPAPASNPAVISAGPAPRGRPRFSREDRSAPVDAPAPPGFVRGASRHFTIFAERYPASEHFIALIESLHSNLMLDLAPFTPWANNERTTIFLFKNQETYRQVTGRPAWSGGASSVGKRKLYVYESEELPGIVAHELTHIYFDSFFQSGTADPLWLSEGMATLIQVERGLAAPNWLRENLERLEHGDSFPIGELTGVTTTAGWPDTKVRLWYAQSYSIVRFLIRTQYRSSFYKFSAHLRDGRPAPEALYRAYGAPYTRMAALEHAWRYELSRSRTAKIGERSFQPLAPK